MISLKELLKGKQGVVKALNAMCDGLEHQDKRDDFIINMGTFGHMGVNKKSNTRICVGCATTCALQQLAGIDLNMSNIENIELRAGAFGYDMNEMNVLQTILNYVRARGLLELFKFCGVEFTNKLNPLDTKSKFYWLMNTDNWKESVIEIRKYINFLTDKWKLAA